MAWQGGEPTMMGLDFFRRAVELQQRHRRPGQRICCSRARVGQAAVQVLRPRGQGQTMPTRTGDHGRQKAKKASRYAGPRPDGDRDP